jgi:hypothetical protein
MMLYEKKISPAGKVSYIEHAQENVTRLEIDRKQVVSLVSALAISFLMSVEEQFPPHAALGRRVKAVEQSIVSLAQLNGEPLDSALIHVGVGAWSAAINTIISELSGNRGLI